MWEKKVPQSLKAILSQKKKNASLWGTHIHYLLQLLPQTANLLSINSKVVFVMFKFRYWVALRDVE